MDDNNMDYDMVLDLNHDPPLDVMETSSSSQNGIENRIRMLEVVNSRVMSRPRNRRLIEPVNEALNDDGRMRNCKRDITHLAKALEMDIDGEKGGAFGDNGNGNFFDCNICLDVAKDPVLTCCGHLFCWPCFYQVAYVDSVSKECPVCKGEVVDSNIPPRPRARRVESVRQQSFGRGNVHIQLADMPRRPLASGMNLLSPLSGIRLNNSEAETSREGRQLSMVVSESTASISSTSSLLNNAERFTVGNLETFISNDGRGTSVGNNTVGIQLNPLQNLATAVLRIGSLATGGSVEIDLTISRSASTRRRGASTDMNVEDESSSEHRRRRLRFCCNLDIHEFPLLYQLCYTEEDWVRWPVLCGNPTAPASPNPTGRDESR
ncbi:Zinc finger, RING/FYVE/PHD-type [Artemisia annua]|uniref:E3 ubiquitin-protein ligase RMA n=1 Tax=Artemisia annua TaxID=35608 RepID=A0A2U1MHG7_ARTAN|nr:Zinc finger, RING/FYVE/PHD-type [Artemisia annua]